MSFKDDFSSMVNRGTSAASRKARQVSLNSKANELRRQRQVLVAQLGASLYEQVKADPALRSGREELLSQIQTLDNQRREIELEQKQLQNEVEHAQIRATVYQCAVCGAPIRATDQFCSTCGATAERALPQNVRMSAASGPSCPNCGAPISDDDAFCMACGTRLTVTSPQNSQPTKSIAAPVTETVEVASYETPVSSRSFNRSNEDVEEVTVNQATPEIESTERIVEEVIEEKERPVSNEELSSEIETLLTEEADVQEMVSEIKDELPAAMESEYVPASTQKNTQTSVCPQCGEPISPDDVFCMNCGHKMEDQAPINARNEVKETPRFCQNCGAPLDPDYKFCGKCGQPIA